jgi:hypothetical protein
MASQRTHARRGIVSLTLGVGLSVLSWFAGLYLAERSFMPLALVVVAFLEAPGVVFAAVFFGNLHDYHYVVIIANIVIYTLVAYFVQWWWHNWKI